MFHASAQVCRCAFRHLPKDGLATLIGLYPGLGRNSPTFRIPQDIDDQFVLPVITTFDLKTECDATVKLPYHLAFMDAVRAAAQR